MLGQRQVTPRWKDDPVRRHVGGGGVSTGGSCPPPPRSKSGSGKRGRGGLSKKVLKN